MTENHVMRMFEKKNGLTARVINEQSGEHLTPSALNRHLRNLIRDGELYRKMEHGAYVYYRSGGNKR